MDLVRAGLDYYDYLYTLRGMICVYTSCLIDSDMRVEGWFLMDSIQPTLISIAVYLVFLAVGPQIMKSELICCVFWLTEIRS
jgi:hypothetical protein